MRLAALAVCVTIAGSAGAAPFRPADDDVIVGRLPPGMSAERQTAWRKRLAQDPGRVEVAVAAARVYLREARATADPRYEGYAQAALAPWWQADDAPIEVLMLRAALLERRHDFGGALADLDLVLAREPRHGQAWLSRASILQVRGEYLASLQACRQLPGATSRLVRAACIAGAAGLLAGGEDALAELRVALGHSRRDAPETKAWAEAVRGDIALAKGRDDEAETAFRSGLQFNPTDAYLRTRLADFLTDRDRRVETLELMAADSGVVEFALRRARALPAAAPEADAIKARLEEIFAAARRRGDPPHLRSEAYFRLFVTAQPRRALELAVENFRMQREPFDVRLVLEAALASGEHSAGQAAIDWLRDAGVEHAQLARLVNRLQDSGR